MTIEELSYRPGVLFGAAVTTEELSYRLGFAAGVHSVSAPGGRAKSRAKSAAARANGKLGGRPKGSKNTKPRKPRA